MADDGSSPFQWWTAGDAAFAAAGQAIQAAARSVWLEIYIYADSPLGQRVRDQLTAAARRGVAVRVLVDAVGSFELADSFWRPLREAGADVRWFNPLSLGGFAIRAIRFHRRFQHRRAMARRWRALGLARPCPLR